MLARDQPSGFGWLGLGHVLFSFAISHAAFSLLDLVVLFAHKSLYNAHRIWMLGMTMRTRVFGFNPNLILRSVPGLTVLLLSLVVSGCLFHKDKEKEKAKPEEEHSKRDKASLRLYLEVNPDGSDRSEPVSIGRISPFQINVEKKAFLTEFNIEHAAVLESFGGYSLSVRFNKEGTWLLEQYTTANKGKRIAIAAEFGQLRWLGAPVIRQRIADGHLVFTPDATREESERIASGLNRVAEENKKNNLQL